MALRPEILPVKNESGLKESGVFPFDPDNLIVSLTEIFPALSEGVTGFDYDAIRQELAVRPNPVSSRDKPPYPVIRKTKNSLSVFTSPYIYSHPNTYLNLRLKPDGFVSGAYNADYCGSELSVCFDQQALSRGGFFDFQALILLPVIRHLHNLPLNYRGDHRVLHFTGLGNYSPEQLGLIFKDGQVPDIPIQEHMVDSLFLVKPSITRTTLPEFTFNPDKHDYGSDAYGNTCRGYLIDGDGNNSVGAELAARALVFDGDYPDIQPYLVSVETTTMIGYSQKQRGGEKFFTELFGKTYVSDGLKTKTYNHEKKPFIIIESPEYLRSNPVVLPVQAFINFIGNSTFGFCY